ncbi:MAG: Rho termination factor N-terminal domain-containing protein [Desulfobacterales bacterium]|jgi:hypothetical protein
MPKAWSQKEERQYEHIKESARESGKSAERAKEIAARTVNKQRRKKGKTPQKTTQGTGNPNTRLENRTKQELYNRARQLKIQGRSSMSKRELIDAIREKNDSS